MNEWITCTPGVLNGKPCIKGTRISVEFLLELIASGATPAQITQTYPQVPPDALSAAMRYAVDVLRNETPWDVRDSA